VILQAILNSFLNHWKFFRGWAWWLFFTLEAQFYCKCFHIFTY